MLNRLFIVVGLLAILAIIAGFTVPFFVDWSAYRTRLEAIASEALGQEVHVRGDFDVGFLPQPRIRLEKVVVGPANAPVIEVGKVVAEFSLLDFLRDYYSVTKLVLTEPQVHLSIDEQGRFAGIVNIPERTSSTNISIANADIVDGVLLLADDRSGDRWVGEAINGKLQVSGLRGPFSLQGAFAVDGVPYDGRMSTSQLSPEGRMQTSVYVRPGNGGFSLSLEGIAETKPRLAFDGNVEFKYALEQAADAAGVRGDLIFTSKLTADAREWLFSDYMVLPDANRPATRLTGAASYELGAAPKFNAVLSGGVVTLGAPTDLTGEASAAPQMGNSIIDILAKLPVPYMPKATGRLGVDLSEFTMQGLTLRKVFLDAQSTGDGWDITSFDARLAGDTLFSLKGQLGAQGDRPTFGGRLVLDTKRMGAFAAQWQKPETVQALFNVPGRLEGQVVLGDGLLSLTGAELSIDDVKSKLSMELTEGAAKELSISAQLGRFDGRQSQMLSALAPSLEQGGKALGAFDMVSFDIDAPALELWQLGAEDVQLAGNWAGGQMNVERFTARDWGGVTLDVSLGIAGNILQPRINGAGALQIASGDSALLDKMLVSMGAKPELKQSIMRFAPLATRFNLSPGEGDAQSLRAEGEAGALTFDGALGFSQGIAKAFNAPLRVDGVVQIADGAAVADQFSLVDFPMTADAETQLEFVAEGSLTNSLDVQAKLANAHENLAYAGSLIVTDGTGWRGKGKLDFALDDFAPMAALLGADGFGFGGIAGNAELAFGPTKLSAANIAASLGGLGLKGQLARESAAISGDLLVDAIDVGQVAGLFGGVASVAIPGDVWPQGPFGLVEGGRVDTGRIKISSAVLRHAGQEIATKPSFELVWSADDTRIRGFSAEIESGQVTADVSICCHSNLAERQAKGRLTLSGVPLHALLAAGADGVDGVADMGVQFSSSGASYAEFMRAMTGEGNFALRDLSIEGFAPAVFDVLGDVQDVLKLDEAALETRVRAALASGAFEGKDVGGVFSIAGGGVRLSNIVAANDNARLLGDLRVALPNLGLDGRWTMTPIAQDAAAHQGAQVAAILTGTLLNPNHSFDLAPMIDEVKFQAYEREVEQLETAKAAQDARAAETQKERALMRAEQARILAEQRDREAAAEAAKQKAAAEEEKKRLAEEEAQRQRKLEREQAVDLLTEQPLTDGPQVNQLDPNFKLPQVTFQSQPLF